MKFFYSVFFVIVLIQLVCAQQKVGIGILLAEDQNSVNVPLESAIFTANSLQEVFDFKTHKIIIPDTDSFQASKILCNLTQSSEGIAGVFGPMKRVMTLPIIQSVCMNLEIPHIQISWRPSATYSMDSTVINLHPDPGLLAQGFATIIKNLGWKSFVLLYENHDGLIRLQDALKIQEYEKNNNKNSVIVRQLINGPDYRTLLKEISSAESNIILDCETDHITDILLQAKEMKLMQAHHRYLLTSLDAHTIDLEFLESPSNITTVRILDIENENFLRAIGDWRQYLAKDVDERRPFEFEFENEFADPYSIKTESTLIYDAVTLFIETVQSLQLVQPIIPHGLSCTHDEKWTDGLRITSFMQTKDNPSTISGPVNFDNYGRRTNFTLYVIEGNRDKIIAKWYPDTPLTLNFTKSDIEREEALAKSLEGSKLIVSSRLGAPYLKEVVAEEGQILLGNQRYEGYSMDLIAAIAKIHKFDFEFRLTPDNAYGKKNEVTGKWDGLIRDLLEKQADLAICDLTITHARRQAVDFSLPFMTLGVSILFKKPEPEKINMFAFLRPFSFEVWIYTATLYLAISVILYFVARLTPDDWENPHPCDENPEELENIWDIKNCFWLTLGSIMAQGCDILPKGISSRMATSMWWFFSLIMMSSYTANLAAFLTTERLEGSINSADDLVKQTKVKYGTVRDGATQAFFRDSNFTTYQRMWTNMKNAKPDVFEASNADGVKRVKNGDYAFLMESTQIEYEVETECELKQVGNRLDSKNYGIGMRPGFQYRNMINKAILELQENGQLAAIKRKWWKEKRDKPSCSELESSTESASAELALANVGGVFLVLGVGVGIAFLLGMAEFLWNVRNISVEEHLSYMDVLKAELIFALNIWITKKKAKPQISESSGSTKSEGDAKSLKSMAHSILHGATSFLNLREIKSKDSNE